MRNHSWTTAEESRLSELYRDGRTLKEIAAALGRTHGQVRHKASEMGLSGRWKPRRPDFQAAVARLHAKGWHDFLIAFELGCRWEAVARARGRLGLARNLPPGRRAS